jgi:hypothetical protein
VRPDQPGLAGRAHHRLGRLKPKNEDPGRIGGAPVEPAGLGERLDQRQVTLGEVDPPLARGRPERGEGPAILLDDDAVAGAQRDVVAGIVVEILQPDPPRPPAALDLDLRDFGQDLDAARLRQHRRQPPRRGPDRVDALVTDAAHHADRGAIAGDAAHLDLRVGRLAFERLGDAAAQRLGAGPARVDGPGIGHVDLAAFVDLHLFEHRHPLPDAGEQPAVDVLPDRHGNRVAGADRVGRDHAGADELRREAERLGGARDRRDRAVDRHDPHICQRSRPAGGDLACRRPGSWQRAGR